MTGQCAFASDRSGIRCQEGADGEHPLHWARDTEGRIVMKRWGPQVPADTTGEEAARDLS